MLDLYKNIKLQRQKLGLTQSDLAKRLGYADKSMIAKIENGNIDLPQSKIVAFSNALNVTPNFLMGWESESTHTNSQWGDDNANREYLEDNPELLELYNDIRGREDIYLLFDKVKDLDPKDVESILSVVQTIRNAKGFDD